jgi:hypothetical protein
MRYDGTLDLPREEPEPLAAAEREQRPWNCSA